MAFKMGPWESIEDCLNRLQRALRDEDQLLTVGSAKELVEATAPVVLDARGRRAASGEDYQHAVQRAHGALERQPGPDLAGDPAIRAIAQGAKPIAVRLRDLRNDHGTGHGRAIVPDVAEEIMLVSIDAAMLWSRCGLDGRCATSGTLSPACHQRSRGTLTKARSSEVVS
jgi:hypothetical protein